MICAYTASSILNDYPETFKSTSRLTILQNYYSRLPSIVSRRIWAERAAFPICSRYVQALIELLASVNRACPTCYHPSSLLHDVSVDSATPCSLVQLLENGDTNSASWEWDEGWVSNDSGWEVWTGSVHYFTPDWEEPSRSAVRSLMDGGEGPPMLREGCTVLRGVDWDDEESPSGENEDGKDLYEHQKAARQKEKIDNEKSRSGDDKADDPKIDSSPHSVDEDKRNEEEFNPVNDKEESKHQNLNLLDDEEENKEENLNPVNAEKENKEQNSFDESNSKNPQNDDEETDEKKATGEMNKKRKVSAPKLPIGTVLSVEPWKGLPGMGRRVKWSLTNKEGVYRYGGDGGKHDISHVEVNEKGTKVRKRHPLPETAEQSAFRNGFGKDKTYNVLLRVRKSNQKHELNEDEKELVCDGILEWPDFGAAVTVECRFYEDGAVSLTEKRLLYGSKDSGWEGRFGQPHFFAGTTILLSKTGTVTNEHSLADDFASHLSCFEELLGSTSHQVEKLRNRADGGMVRVACEMRLLRWKSSHASITRQLHSSSRLPPIKFDPNCHASSLKLSRDNRTVACISSEGRCTAFGSVGFTKGVHYWEVKIEHSEQPGSIFIGVAEKPPTSSSGVSYGGDRQSRLNRWLGWGFVNFRATYAAGSERVYGAHCLAGDIIGILLDCDAGRLSYFIDGIKYGEHIINDLGCAFENLSPFGFNADGCGGGGIGQGAANGRETIRGGRHPADGMVRPKALWPVIGLRNPRDKVTMTEKWMTSYGVDGNTQLRNAMAVDRLLSNYTSFDCPQRHIEKEQFSLPVDFICESYAEYCRWQQDRWCRIDTRGGFKSSPCNYGLEVDVDTDPIACAVACASIGLSFVLLPGDRVSVKRSGGRILELSEEAVILGSCQGRLWYQLVSQKSEGGSLTEGGGRPWYWDESEVVECHDSENNIKRSVEIIGDESRYDLRLPLMQRFKPNEGLRIVYEGGALLRSDIEIFESSNSLGTIPSGIIIEKNDVLERRVNSCGLVRYRVRYEPVGIGWISSRIRGGDEELVVEALKDPLDTNEEGNVLDNPLSCAKIWFDKYQNMSKKDIKLETWAIDAIEEYQSLLHRGVIEGMNPKESDEFLTEVFCSIGDLTSSGDPLKVSFSEVSSALTYALKCHALQHCDLIADVSGQGRVVAALFSRFSGSVLPPIKALLARMSMLRAFNRRVKYASPWFSFRLPQECSAILGGLSGFGASAERAGKTGSSGSLEKVSQIKFVLFFTFAMSSSNQFV